MADNGGSIGVLGVIIGAILVIASAGPCSTPRA